MDLDSLSPNSDSIVLDMMSGPVAPSMLAPPMWLQLNEDCTLEDLERELAVYASSGDECPTSSPFTVAAPAVDWQLMAASLQQDPVLLHETAAATSMAMASTATTINLEDQSDGAPSHLLLQSSGDSSSLASAFGVVPTAFNYSYGHGGSATHSSSSCDEDSGHMSDVSVHGGVVLSFSGSSPTPSSFPDLEDDECSNGDGDGTPKPFSQARPFSRKSRGNFLANLSELERRLLIEEGYEFPDHDVLTKEEERHLKSLRRKIKNKLSAQDSRKKKKEYMSGLEGRVKVTSTANKQLKLRVESLEAENRTLLDQLREMKASLERMTRTSGSKKAGTALMLVGLCFAFFLNPGASYAAFQQPGSAAASGAASGFADAPSTTYAPTTFKSRTLMSSGEEEEDVRPMDATTTDTPSLASAIFGNAVPSWLAEILSSKPGELPASLQMLEEQQQEGYSDSMDGYDGTAHLGGPTEVPAVLPRIVELEGETEEGDEDEGETRRKGKKRREDMPVMTDLLKDGASAALYDQYDSDVRAAFEKQQQQGARQHAAFVQGGHNMVSVSA